MVKAYLLLGLFATKQASCDVKTIPGNRYFRLDEESYYFNRNLPLEVQGYEGRLNREIRPLEKWWVNLLRT